MRSIFNKQLSSFSISSCSNNSSNNTNTNTNTNKSQSQPNSPTQPFTSVQSSGSSSSSSFGQKLLKPSPHSSIGLSFNDSITNSPNTSNHHQTSHHLPLVRRSQQTSTAITSSGLYQKRMLNKPNRSSEPIYIGLDPSDPLHLMRINPPSADSSSNGQDSHTPTQPAGSHPSSNSNLLSPTQRPRSSSLVESLTDSLSSLPAPSNFLNDRSSSSILSRHRKRWSNFFNNPRHSSSGHRSRSPSPSPYLVRFRHRRSSSSGNNQERRSTTEDPRSGSLNGDGSNGRDEEEEEEEEEEDDDDDVISLGSSEQYQTGTEEEEEEEEEEEDTEGTESTEDEEKSEDGSEVKLREEEDEEEEEEATKTILANTNANSSSVTPIDFLQSSDQPIPFLDQAPNLTSPPPKPISFTSATDRRKVLRKNSSIKSSSSLRGRRSGSVHQTKLELQVSRPIYERNRCTISIENGNHAEASKKAERTRFYLVASDLSEESKYAIEWTIGTVLRQGDECLIIMIIETETKFDPGECASQADRTAKIRNQKDRQEKATSLVREATSLLERTRLNVRVTCQAVHAKNAKHMLVDCIDYLEPNLVIVGSQGSGKISRTLPGSSVLGTSGIPHSSSHSSTGFLMGSVSNYLVHKSSVPVMVARRKLRAPLKVYKKKIGTIKGPRTKLEQAAIESIKKPTETASSVPTNTSAAQE